jgi:redox-sensitive bicupin YhaK (pirin superfamily)
MPVKNPDDNQEEDSLTTHGLQLWVNLSSKDKLCEPQYQDLKDNQIPRVTPTDGVDVKVIAGEAHGVQSKVFTRTPTMYLDYKMKQNRAVELGIPKGYGGFVYMLSGKAYFGDGAVSTKPSKQGKEQDGQHDETKSTVTLNDTLSRPFEGLPHHALILSQDNESDTLRVRTTDKDAHFVVIAGQPLKEPVVQDRLFVMNSMQEVQQALDDFRQFKNGFENAKTWRSTIGPKSYRFKF